MTNSREGNLGRAWVRRLAPYIHRAQAPCSLVVEGKLTRMVGLTVEAVGCQAAIGDRCMIRRPGAASVDAEVVGFSGDRLLLMPIGEIRGVAPNAQVIPVRRGGGAKVGDALLGRVVNGTGSPLDGKRMPECKHWVPLSGDPVNPLLRQPIRTPLDVGVRAINALLTVGRGQRLGLFAPSGVGKSVLLGMMTRFTNADVVVVGLIGERGREVQEFISNILGDGGMERAVVVASPADDPPLMRLHGAALATSIAEHFRSRGHDVLLLMDSLTRFAQAQRELALAIGEPPATRGYPPSVFTRLPQLVERAGNGNHGKGSITAFYTVLTERDDTDDPIAEAARAILDGHVVLSPLLAEQGLYPAIDLEASVSRAMTAITDSSHQENVRGFRRLNATYRQNYDLVNVGAYTHGADARLDEAIAMHPRLMEFLNQDMHQAVSLSDSLSQLSALLGQGMDMAQTG